MTVPLGKSATLLASHNVRRSLHAWAVLLAGTAALCPIGCQDRPLPPLTPHAAVSDPTAARTPFSTIASTAASTASLAPVPLIISLFGTSDLHGRIGSLPLYAGYIQNLRAVRARTGGAVVLGDAGDMFQGTLESSMVEGASVVRAYAALGMNAVAIGNHEFDFGPVGPHSVPDAGEDPRGALKANAAAAPFPFLAANILEAGKAPTWPNTMPSTLVIASGIRVGFIGVTTTETASTTLNGNVLDITVAPIASAIRREAGKLRNEQHADLVIVLAHAGGECATFLRGVENDGCDATSEIFNVARSLEGAGVDAIVAAHTHKAIADEVAGIPIIESLAQGRAFGRIDFELDRATHKPVHHTLFAPQNLCARPQDNALTCEAPAYEGAPVTRDPNVLAIVNADLAKAVQRKSELLGVTLLSELRRGYHDESALLNAYTDFLLESTPAAQVAITNSGGVTANLPAGPLTFGALFESMPFDNRLTLVRTTYGRLRQILADHETHHSGIFSVAGVSSHVSCTDKGISIELKLPSGRTPRDQAAVTVVTSDFLALGGDSFWGHDASTRDADQASVAVSDTAMRDVLERKLRSLKTLSPSDHFNPAKPRIVYASGLRHPVRCGDASAAKP